MTTVVGSASSRSPDPKTAAIDVVRRARARLGSAKPSYGFVFASPDRDLRATLAHVAEAADGAQIVGATTAGELTEIGLSHGSVALMLVSSDASGATVAFSEQLSADPLAAASALTLGVPEAKKAAAQRDRRHLTTVLLTDGLCGAGEKLVVDLHGLGQGSFQIVGGAAGDEGKFQATSVGANGRSATNAAAAMHVLSASPWGVGVNHGLRSTTTQMRVTKAQGNVVQEIDGQPAFKVYERHAAERGVKLNAAEATPYMVSNQLGIHFFQDIARSRAPLSVGEDLSLTCAAEIPKGSMVSILDGDPVSMVDAARSAAEEAKQHLDGKKAAGVLLFDCVCRGMILKDGFDKEIEAVRSVFGSVPITGFLTYGEIARYPGKLNGWHNATAVVVAIPE
jgi:methyl-accepting chemotaxis protein